MADEIKIHVEGTEKVADKLASAMGALGVALCVAVGVWALVHLSVLRPETHILNNDARVSDAQSNHDVNQIDREESAQQRADKRVGASPLPVAPVKLELASRSGCLSFDSGYLDNGNFTGYLRNKCSLHLSFYQVSLSEYAPDGTVIGGFTYNTATMPELGPNERGEIHLKVGGFGQDMDARTVRVKATVYGEDN